MPTTEAAPPAALAATARHAGQTRFAMARLPRLACTGISAFTNLPLRQCSAPGVGIAGPAMALGAQLLPIGIVGEYSGRIFDEVKQRPDYRVQDALGSGPLQTSPQQPEPPHG